MIWKYLSAVLSGVRFRNQYIIGNYIVDFVALKRNLIIEIDGDYHHDRVQEEFDAHREQWLRDAGFTVIRFTNDDVMTNIQHVLKTIKSELF